VYQRVVKQARQREKSELKTVQECQQQLEHSKRKVDIIREKIRHSTEGNARELHTMVA
jgi:hypothetical protein